MTMHRPPRRVRASSRSSRCRARQRSRATSRVTSFTRREVPRPSKDDSGRSGAPESPLQDADPNAAYRRNGACRTPSTGSSRTWTTERDSWPLTRKTTVYDPTGTSCR
jgi:hypothetical protein